jgi:hypothetical protein
MRKYRLAAVAAAGVMVLAAPAGVALASGAHSAANKPVLRVGKTSGAAVKNGAKLSAGLVKRGKVVLVIATGSTKYTGTCTKSSIAAKVTKNPSAKGKATFGLTGLKISNCTLNPVPIPGTKLTSLTPLNLPSATTLNVKGDSVTISQAKASKPLGFKAVIDVPGVDSNLACYYTTAKITGKFSNKAGSVTFTKQVLTLNTSLTGSTASAFCAVAGKTSTFSVAYGPVRDISVKHRPRIYVS